MKTKLNALELSNMTKKELNNIIGGYDNCICSCYYRYVEGSDIRDNASANSVHGYHSIKGDVEMVMDREGNIIWSW